VDVGGNPREAEAFGAHFEELVFGFVRMHGTSFRIIGTKDQTLHWLYWLYWLFVCREGRLERGVRWGERRVSRGEGRGAGLRRPCRPGAWLPRLARGRCVSVLVNALRRSDARVFEARVGTAV
jgi:hypothetical protein